MASFCTIKVNKRSVCCVVSSIFIVIFLLCLILYLRTVAVRSCRSKCKEGFYCYACYPILKGGRCVRRATTNPFRILNISLPFNKYAFLATHNSFAIKDEATVPIAVTCQEDRITQQLQNGVRALMLDMYDFKGDVWLCHSIGGKCHEYTAFEPAINTMMEIEAFLSSNPMEIVTLILEDYVKAPNGLTNLFREAGLKKYWFPASEMPTEGQDWPIVRDMVANNQRLIVFTSKKSKQITEGIAYQWDYMVENQYGDNGMKKGQCTNRGESSLLDDKSKSLVLINYIRSIPLKQLSCVDNSHKLKEMLSTCHVYAGDRWANFVAVDFYKRSEGGGVFEALDMLNGRLLCGRDDVHACVVPPPRNNTVP